MLTAAEAILYCLIVVILSRWNILMPPPVTPPVQQPTHDNNNNNIRQTRNKTQRHCDTCTCREVLENAVRASRETTDESSN